MYITDHSNNYNNDSDTSSRFSEEQDQLDLLTTRINKNLEKISNLQDSGLELLISVNQRHGPINKTCRVVPEVRDQINVVLEKAIEPSIKLGKKISNDIDRVLLIMSQSDDVYKRWSRKRDRETIEVRENDEKHQIKRIKVYEVEDADEETKGPGGETQELPEFPVSHLVYALYPKTTCFYKASVVVPPKDNNALRYVDALYVLDISEHKP
ncbi:6421_t:CDS:2 [Diversispora eburnea]|uniref:6421_t:CDS:1 n=1 Tax=Diversispora eburnea TaxID=1213867 RepID=A0A9N8VSH7_9GLOM|nr:6421_t:CDS:2 [Diversispora eburnea]